MTTLISFKDAVNADVLDPEARYAVYYTDGDTANEAAVRARCPHAKLFGITVHGETGPHVFACDSETGDLTIPETVVWVAEQVKLDVHPIVVYANQDRWLNQGLLKELAHYGTRIERWDADFDGSETIPPWADAKQYSSTDVDLDVARANFFEADKAASGTAAFRVTYNLRDGSWTARNLAANVTLGEKDLWASAELQYNRHTGRVRIRPLPFNAPPLG